MTKMVVVHIAVDTWRGVDLQTSILGAWSTSSDVWTHESSDELLAGVRQWLGAEYAPATVEQITEWHKAFTANAEVPWEQISLF